MKSAAACGMPAIRVITVLVAFVSSGALAEDAAPKPDLAERARASIIAAGRVFAEELGLEGSYVYEYRQDLSARRAEGSVDATVGWAEPPGTPAVGAAFLRLFEATGDPSWLDAAHKVGEALLRTQLLSGGWNNALEFDPLERRSWCYRVDGITAEGCRSLKGNQAKDKTLLDDDTTQAAIRFLIWLDRVLEGKDQPVREALLYALESVLAAQYPNGGWPPFYETGRSSHDAPVKRASLPTEWSRTWIKPSGGPYYVLNDNLVRDTVHVLLLAELHLGERVYLDAAKRAGEFLISAQLPEPQRGWAQTYDGNMHPTWGRQFEPPSVASLESAGAVSALLELYGRTGESGFLDAAEGAGAWLTSSRLPDSNWARFYELGTNDPLYVDSDGQLTYSPHDLHRGYAFVGIWDIPRVIEQLNAAAEGAPVPEAPFWPSAADLYRTHDELEAAVRVITRRRNGSPWWIEDGWIRSQTFVDAVFVVTRYLSSSK